jgi:Arc/MetJ-type ribon-helix-helix transcriptional regulator
VNVTLRVVFSLYSNSPQQQGLLSPKYSRSRSRSSSARLCLPSQGQAPIQNHFWRDRCPEKSLDTSMTNSKTRSMSVAKVTVSVESGLLKRIDHLVKARIFANRSQAFQAAIQKTVVRLNSNRLARECAKLDKAQEQELADEGLA